MTRHGEPELQKVLTIGEGFQLKDNEFDPHTAIEDPVQLNLKIKKKNNNSVFKSPPNSGMIDSSPSLSFGWVQVPPKKEWGFSWMGGKNSILILLILKQVLGLCYACK